MLSKVTIGPMLNPKDCLLEKPVIIRVIEFDESSVSRYIDEIGKAISFDMPFVPMVVQSRGGSVYGLLALIEAIRSCPVPVATILEGKALSAGAFLFALGTMGWRFVSPYGYLGLHHVSSTVSGSWPDLREDAHHTEQLDNQLFRLLDEHCGYQAGFFQDRLKEKEGANWYLTPGEAKDLRLADHLHVPTLRTDVRVTMRLEPQSRVGLSDHKPGQ
jgi:ATP-dependent Clp protease, protease subunit